MFKLVALCVILIAVVYNASACSVKQVKRTNLHGHHICCIYKKCQEGHHFIPCEKDGEPDTCVPCEDGKVNLDKFETKDFSGDEPLCTRPDCGCPEDTIERPDSTCKQTGIKACTCNLNTGHYGSDYQKCRYKSCNKTGMELKINGQCGACDAGYEKNTADDSLCVKKRDDTIGPVLSQTLPPKPAHHTTTTKAYSNGYIKADVTYNIVSVSKNATVKVYGSDLAENSTEKGNITTGDSESSSWNSFKIGISVGSVCLLMIAILTFLVICSWRYWSCGSYLAVSHEIELNDVSCDKQNDNTISYAQQNGGINGHLQLNGGSKNPTQQTGGDNNTSSNNSHNNSTGAKPDVSPASNSSHSQDKQSIRAVFENISNVPHNPQDPECIVELEEIVCTANASEDAPSSNINGPQCPERIDATLKYTAVPLAIYPDENLTEKLNSENEDRYNCAVKEGLSGNNFNDNTTPVNDNIGTGKEKKDNRPVATVLPLEVPKDNRIGVIVTQPDNNYNVTRMVLNGGNSFLYPGPESNLPVSHSFPPLQSDSQSSTISSYMGVSVQPLDDLLSCTLEDIIEDDSTNVKTYSEDDFEANNGQNNTMEGTDRSQVTNSPYRIGLDGSYSNQYQPDLHDPQSNPPVIHSFPTLQSDENYSSVASNGRVSPHNVP